MSILPNFKIISQIICYFHLKKSFQLSFEEGKLSLSIKISCAGPSKSSNCPALIAHKKAQIINPININDIGINKNNISINTPIFKVIIQYYKSNKKSPK